jgi:importin subunit beta-1
MNVNAVLEGTLSGGLPTLPSLIHALSTVLTSIDANVRREAELQLTQAADADFVSITIHSFKVTVPDVINIQSAYLTTLATELANESAQTSTRQAAALALKNSLSAREYGRLRHMQERWLNQVDLNIKMAVKQLALKTLSTNDSRVGQADAQFIAAIAAVELPRNMWPELMSALVTNVGEGVDHQKQASLTAIGYICDTEDLELRQSLENHSNAILTAVIQGARKEETNPEVRNAAITALSDSLEFVRSNFENEGERNYIMQVICEATQADDIRIQQGAFGCLNRIMGLYYDKMRFYMEKALFGLTVQGMRSEEEDVAKLAVEFWCTVCEEEISIEDDNTQAAAEGSTELREYHNFARIATSEVVPVLLELLTKQDEDATDDEYNISRAAYQCLQLWAQTVQGIVVAPVLQFVEKNLRSDNWHYRDAAVSAFGAIVEGPDEKVLDPIVRQALPILIGMMTDPVVQVKDSAAYALGRICECCFDSIDPNQHLAALIQALFAGLASERQMASSCCWALMNLADRFVADPGSQVNPLTPYFQTSVTQILQVTGRRDVDSQVRTAAYEVLNSFVGNAANDSLTIIAELSTAILDRLEETIPMQSQVVSVEDKLTVEDMQTSLTSVILSIVARMDSEIKPQGDRIISVCLNLLNTVPPKSSVPETVFAAIGALANALELDFLPYMEPFAPYLFKGLENQEETSLCSMAIGLVSDITRALGEKVQPWCDDFMNRLLADLQSQVLGNQFKPAILQCFGDIAQAIGGYFETYLPVVAQVLNQAATVNVGMDVPMELVDYIVSLREGIMDAWDGAIVAMSKGNKCRYNPEYGTRLFYSCSTAELLKPYVEIIFQMLHTVFQDPNRTEALLRSSMGVIG